MKKMSVKYWDCFYAEIAEQFFELKELPSDVSMELACNCLMLDFAMIATHKLKVFKQTYNLNFV